ncbi:hypothetical protein KRX51_06510 [Corynebacterium sp. TAE3-ERU12]|uniref:hypothetical protein n=1 Tax=Corynebacterium sp. TAE3-ERU12 TaxID=2849491 RepID=UPI001C46B6BB|nr:hypothetical protein [Corynebacterium sp. TAE3-ERU12]MBV7295569.1 hypothetical protein [Corynebacterium sp. TAE3-ERU12]
MDHRAEELVGDVIGMVCQAAEEACQALESRVQPDAPSLAAVIATDRCSVAQSPRPAPRSASAGTGGGSFASACSTVREHHNGHRDESSGGHVPTLSRTRPKPGTPYRREAVADSQLRASVPGSAVVDIEQ